MELTLLAGFIIASYYDVKYRDVPLKLFAITCIMLVFGGLADYLAGTLKGIYADYVWILNILILSSIALIVRYHFMGEGDLAYFALIAFSRPLGLVNECAFPILFNTLVYYVAILAFYSIILLSYNSIFNYKHLSNLKRPCKYLYPFIAIPMNIDKFISNPGWWYPLNICNNYSIAFNIYDDPADVVRIVKEALSKGCRQEKVWATYGIPAIPLIGVSYLLALIVGDKPIILFVQGILGASMPCLASSP